MMLVSISAPTVRGKGGPTPADGGLFDHGAAERNGLVKVRFTLPSPVEHTLQMSMNALPASL
jgi:hypothetical protein